jgi:hypothetical protein
MWHFLIAYLHLQRTDARWRRGALCGPALRQSGWEIVYSDGKEKDLKDRLMTVLPRHAEYALNPQATAAYPPPELAIARIGDLVNYDLSAMLGDGKAGNAR